MTGRKIGRCPECGTSFGQIPLAPKCKTHAAADKLWSQLSAVQDSIPHGEAARERQREGVDDGYGEDFW